MKSTLLLIAAAALVICFSLLWYTQHRFGRGQATLAGQTIPVEIASTMYTRAKGLSGRQSLPDDSGMAFLFPFPGKVAMWMPDMHFSIDIVWARQGKIVDIAPGVPPIKPGTAAVIYRPRLPADTVIELPAGFAQKNGLKIGDDAVVRR